MTGPAAPTTYVEWADAELAALGAPRTQQNEQLLTAWAEGENTKAKFNPLAITDSYGSPVSPFNTLKGGGHVWNFASPADALSATAKFIRNGRYPAIVQALMSSQPDVALAQPGEFDTWGTGGRVVQSNFARVAKTWPNEGQLPLPSYGNTTPPHVAAVPGGKTATLTGSILDLPNPLNGFGIPGAIGGWFGDKVGGDLRQTLVFVVLLGGAVVLAVLGLYRFASPAAERAQQSAGPLIQAAEVA